MFFYCMLHYCIIYLAISWEQKKYRHVHVYIMPINCLTSSFSLDILMSLLTKSLLYAKNGYVCVCVWRDSLYFLMEKYWISTWVCVSRGWHVPHISAVVMILTHASYIEKLCPFIINLIIIFLVVVPKERNNNI